MDVPALAGKLPHIRRGEGAPFRQLFGSGVGGGLLILQGFFAVQTVFELCEELLKIAVGHYRALRRILGILLQDGNHPGQIIEALEVLLVGGGLLGKMDYAQLLQPIQQDCFFRSSRHHMDDLHFFNHRPTSCSFFLAILPRTTAEVC